MWSFPRLPMGPLARPLRAVRRLLPPVNFITLHYAYFIFTSLALALILWGSNTPRPATPTQGKMVHVRFIDALFLAVSAMTEAGLNTVNLSELNTFQQILLFLGIMLGSAIWVSIFVVHVRRAAFQKKLAVLVAMRQERRGRSLQRLPWTRNWGRRMVEEGRRGDDGDMEMGPAVQEEKSEEWQMRGRNLTEGKAMTSHENLEGAMEEEGNDDTAVPTERSLTPPERSGGPEMNMADPPSPDRGHLPGITFRDDTRFVRANSPVHPSHRRRSSLFSMDGVGARPGSSLPALSSSGSRKPNSKYGEVSAYFASAAGRIARNSQFHGLSEAEREELGGYEYRAVSLLAWLVPLYFVSWQLFGALGCGAWIAYNNPSSARTNGLNPFWVGAFNAISAFNNSGMSLVDANMTAYQRSYYLLITMSWLILAGNTCYPVFLRLIVWCMWRAVRADRCRRVAGAQWAARQEKTLRFLLDHPRRCYTNLFPARHTWFLLNSVLTLNGIDWAAFEILNLGNHALYAGLPERYRVIDGLFQAFAVRSGGFYVVNIADLRIALQVLYVVMMYISAYPVVITMRNSNVYEERSLGLYAEDLESDEDDDREGENSWAEKGKSSTLGTAATTSPFPFLKRAATLGHHFVSGGAHTGESNGTFVRHQLRAQLAHDAWWIVLALFLIMIIESSHFNANPVVYSVFNFIFEIVSAYGCVGISVGVPWAAYSFSGSWQTLSKLILCAVMLRGRHRGLPVAIDKAILLPGEANWMQEEEDGRIRESRTLSRVRSEGL